jgi:BTB/POZ domain
MRSTPSPVENEEFWFEDGDVVLSVTEDGVEHHFRVHRLILKIASPVFRDMLSMPRPSGGEDLPVPLPGDSVEDLTALLGALYNSRFVVNGDLSGVFLNV